ncbi:MAG TPA: hypothetical protein VF787_23465 [Thermoanaerobaculia bacterium]
MKRLSIAIALAMLLALPAFSMTPRGEAFASDFQMIPVMGNTPGAGGAVFQTYVALLNPTSSAFQISVSLYDPAGVKRDATINMAAGELKTYDNFLDAVFHFTGGGAVTFRSPNPSNRFIVSAEVRTSGTRYSTAVPTVDFAPTKSRAYTPGISVNSNTRTNIGCFNNADVANTITADVYDGAAVKIGTVTLNLAANAWSQAPVNNIVTNGYVRFSPSEPAACYASVVDNATSDGRLIPAVEFEP